MVRERDTSRTSSGQYSPPQKERAPLANISAKMQAPSPKSSQSSEDAFDQPLKPPQQAEFGKASPLRNPLVHKKDKRAGLFVPPSRPVVKKSPPSNPQFHNPMQSHGQGTEPRGFRLPGQAPPSAQPQSQQNWHAAMHVFDDEQPYRRPFQPPPVPIAQPYNRPPVASQPPPRPVFSSLGPSTNYQSWQPPKQVVDLTKQSNDDDDEFDPDEAIRAESGGFGAPDPYMYVDAAQANENIKNLLEGAFDDEEKPKTRLRKRARKAEIEAKEKEVKSLASKLASMDVKPDGGHKSKADAPDTADEDEDEEADDGTIEGMNVKLLPHQVEGVSWMIDKEIGERKRKGVLPNGGILADDMGLGKTIQSISLILTNPRPAPDAKPEHPKQVLPGKEVGRGTLVVAPLALIKQWEAEIKNRVSKSHALKVLVHHGASRTKSSDQLKKYDVVITTYQILTSEHAGSNMSQSAGPHIGCFGVHWYRIILDEAHSIKNRNAKSTQACYALNSWYRWCLTGTPMQNNLDELQSLIKFLRIRPYNEVSQWKASITDPIKRGRGMIGIRRLQFFLKAFMKRRTKDVLKQEGALNFGGKVNKEGEKKNEGMQIVKREVVTVECEFDVSEQEFYDRLQDRVQTRMDDMMKAGEKANYIGALVLLLRLRQACNHPRLIEMAMNKDKDAMTTGMSSQQQAFASPRKGSKVEIDEMDDLANLMGGVTVQAKKCDVCQDEIPSEAAKDGAVRCTACESALEGSRQSKKKSKKQKTKVKNEVKQGKTASDRPMRNRKVVHDDSDDEGEGEWIGEGSEQRVDLGKAGGSDDEDAESGGETLDSIDSDRSEDEDSDAEDSPPRAARRHQAKHGSGAQAEHSDNSEDDQSDTEVSEEDTDDSEDSDDGDDSDNSLPVLAGMRPSGRPADRPSTKIRHLLRILRAESRDHKTIVFSQFTSMLDLIEPHLRAANLAFVRYDGSMRPDQRESSLHSLRNDKRTRVLLCSLKCGSLGLNLTAASRVVIVEPFWNPFVEEQAIDRVHRLNQTVDVKVFRLTIRDTVEERILDLQARKRELAAAAIEGGGSGKDKAGGNLNMKDILNLFKRDAEYEGEHHEGDNELWAKISGDTKLLDGESGGTRGRAGEPVFGEPGSSRGTGAGAHRAGKSGMGREHDVYGRRW